MSGFNSWIARRMTPSSLPTPTASTSWPSSRSVWTTSNSIFQGAFDDVVALRVVGGDEGLVDEGEDALLLHGDIPLTAPAGGARCGGR